MIRSPISLDPSWNQKSFVRVGVSELLNGQHPILDVRSPSEFAQGHIPGAHNAPIFDDGERKEVGTLYKQLGPAAAEARGTDIALQKSPQFLDGIRSSLGTPTYYIHCWRGGMRSQGAAWLCSQAGNAPRILDGGYKTFRRHVHEQLAAQWQFVLISGGTGTGKTELLHQLASAGEQVVDLEKIAGHTGSAFGGIGRPAQPTVEQFENDLFEALRGLDASRRIWMEDESRAIGRVSIPAMLWEQMSRAPMIIVERDRGIRVKRLLQEYGPLPTSELCDAFSRLHKRLGGERLRTAVESVRSGHLEPAVSIALHYYDKAYAKALSGRIGSECLSVVLPACVQAEQIRQMRDLADRWYQFVGATDCT